MSEDIDKIVKDKVQAELKAIESKKVDEDIGFRIFLAFLGACIAGWLSSTFNATGENTLWAIGIGILIGGAYELLQFALFVIFIITLVKCVN